MDPNQIADIGFIATYILVALAIIAIFFSNIINVVNLLINGDFSKLIKGALGLVVFLAVFGICYAISGNEVTEKYAIFNVTPSSSKLIGGAIITTYVMIGLVTVGVFFSIISRVFR